MGAAFVSGFFAAWAVDLFFVWRIWQLSNQALICIFLVRYLLDSLLRRKVMYWDQAVLPTARTAVGIVNTIISFKDTAVAEFLTKLYPTLVAGWALAAVADSLIAITLCYYLHKQRSGMKRTDHIINTLLLYTINTGALTSLFAILVIITFVALPGNLYFTAFVQVQSKLYAISMLASLNARKKTFEDARAAVATSNNVSLNFVGQSGDKYHYHHHRMTPPVKFRQDVGEESFPSTMNHPPFA
ncbi:hypothetical protein J3R83DRAFT_5346 [Lanmaoa asiatica]|nr:hypothetical protein J3R83DRAFT_5346 [Lanmaoa asiatica]